MIAIDSGIKHLGIFLIAYRVYLMALPEKPDARKRMIAGVLLSVIGASMAFLYYLLAPMHFPVLLTAFFLVTGGVFRERVRRNLPLTLLSFALSYAFYYLSAAMLVFGLSGLSYLLAERFGSPIAAMKYFEYLTSEHPVGKVIMSVVILTVQCLLALIVFRTKRMRKGLEVIIRFGVSDFGILITSSTVLVMMVYTFISNLYPHSKYRVDVFTVCFFMGLFCIFMLYFWIKKELRTTYRFRMMENELNLLEKSLSDRDGMMHALRSDNERLAEIIHKDNKLIPSMVMTVRQAAQGMADGKDPSDSIARALEAAASLNEIYVSRSKALVDYETHGVPLPQTGVTAVDAVLLYMQGRAEACGVTFTADVDVPLPEMLTEVIDRREFNTMLADLSENAILSAKRRERGCVAVKIGRKGKRYFLSVSDNGGRFDVDVLKSMGKKPITTHPDEGGSGIGMMTLFRILRNTGASFSIEELPGGEASDTYTKDLCVTFDGAGRLRIVTDRADELKKALRSGRFEVVRSEPC